MPVNGSVDLVHGRSPRIVIDQLDHTRSGRHQLGVHERVEVPVQARGVEIPVDHEHFQSGAGQDPADIGQGHRPARAARV
jgi:hypothetical protein